MARRLVQRRFDGISLSIPNGRIAQNHENAREKARFPVRNYGKDHAPHPDGNFGLCSTCLHGRNIRRVFISGLCVPVVCKDGREFRAPERRCGDSIFRLVFAGAFIPRAARDYNYIRSRYDFCFVEDLDRESDPRHCRPYRHRFGCRGVRIQISSEGLTQHHASLCARRDQRSANMRSAVSLFHFSE